MDRRRFLISGAGAGGLLALLRPAPLAAHHGWGSYDASKTVIFEGPVLRSEWNFPHGHVWLQHDGAEWELVLAPPSRMAARALSAELIAPGKRVRAEGYVSKTVAREARIERITVDGKTVELR